MSYSGFGAVYDATFSVLGKNITASVDVPIEQAARDAVNAALPALQAQIPGALQAVTPQVVDAIKTQVIPRLAPEVKKVVKENSGPIRLAVVLAGAGAVASIYTAFMVMRQSRGA